MVANVVCWLRWAVRAPVAASSGQCSYRWHHSMSLVPFAVHILSSGGIATSKAANIVHHVDCPSTRVNSPALRPRLAHPVRG